MAAARPITIIGGGLAGLTLGLGLRRRDVPVTLCEAGQYPRHRVCGEFICGRGTAVLERLGLLAHCQAAGAVWARTAMFVCGRHRSPARPLPQPALCLSRHVLDALLAGLFKESGGELRTQERRSPTETGEGFVCATGRRTREEPRHTRWFGAKAHVSAGGQVPLEADLEMHLSSRGYIGVNRIDAGQTNVCGLLRATGESLRPESKLDWLRGDDGSLLRERLRGAEFMPDSFCSVAGLSLKPQRAGGRKECCLGDSLTMTPPATGNGMSMAFESAELALDPLTAYSAGELNWPDAQRLVAQRCDAAFARRLAWARFLQTLMSSTALQAGLAPWLLRSGWLWRFMFARTR
jgi:2-polyprenyl-6-methoxyphenol hydroxylase-like FAD-dependent oxidoreductase